MPQASTYQCPNCGGVLSYNVSTGKLTCEFCGGEFDEGELARDIPLGAAVEAREAEHVKSVDEFLQHAPWSAVVENAVSYACPSCGAEVVANQSAVTTSCPYCGNNMVVSGIATSENVPQSVLPFTVTKAQAEQRMREHFQHKWYLSRKFDAELSHMQGVYVPYHVYDMRAWGGGEYLGYHEETDDDGNTHKTGYKAIVRSGYANFAHIPVDGSAKMPDGHMDAIAPFDLGKLKSFSASYVAGYLTEVADESVEVCLPRAEARARNSFEDELRREVRRVRGVDGVEETVDQEVHVDRVRAFSCVLPVWLMHCTWNGHEMLFAVNGDTGRCVGDLPVQKGRRGMTIGGVLLALALVWAFVTLVVLDGDEDQLSVGFGGLLLVAAGVFMVDRHFMGQMRTAVETRDASANFTPEGFVVTEAWDSSRFHVRKGKARSRLDEYLMDRGGRWRPDDAGDGGEVVAGAVDAQVAEGVAGLGTVVCASCGAEVAAGKRFCTMCGAPMPTDGP